MGKQYENFDKVCIGGEWFYGIGYQGLLTVNTKTYVEPPSRTNDGSIPNINDHDSFVVPRCKVNFKLFDIKDYQRLCRVVNSANEFEVTYFDKEYGKFVTHLMYCEPEEMKKMFNVGSYVFGVLDYEISFIGTLNGRKEYSVVYHTNLSSGSSTLPITKYKWGDSMKVLTTSDLTSAGVTIPENQQLSYWQMGYEDAPNVNGWKLKPNANVSVFEEMHLWANWGSV